MHKREWLGVTIGALLLPVFWDNWSLPQEVLQTGTMTTKRVIWGHESGPEMGNIDQKTIQAEK